MVKTWVEAMLGTLFGVEFLFGALIYYILYSNTEMGALSIIGTIVAGVVIGAIVALGYTLHELSLLYQESGEADKKHYSDEVMSVTGCTLIAVVACALASVLLVYNAEIVDYQTTEEVIYHQTRYEDSISLELGQTDTIAEGSDGKKEVKRKIVRRLWTGETISDDIVHENTLTKATDTVIMKGTKRYRYMWCSDNTYLYYSDEVFANSNVGFTWSGSDKCAEGGHGTRTNVSNSPPSTQTYYSGGTLCNDGWISYSTGRGTCSWHGGVAY